VSVVSIVMPSRDEGQRLERTLRGLLRDLPGDAEIVVVDDESTDGSTDHVEELDRRVRVIRPPHRVGVSQARNLGASRTRGDVLVFSDAHVDVPSGWLPPLLDAVGEPDVGTVGVTLVERQYPDSFGHGLRFTDVATNLAWEPPRGRLPYPIPLVPGFFTCMRREVFVAVGGFDPGMVGYGIEDCEMSLHLWSLGFRCLLVPEVMVAHDSRYTEPPAHHAEWPTSLANILRLGIVHYSADRLRRMMEYYRDDPAFPGALAAVLSGDAARRRAGVQAARRRDDDWFFAFCGAE